MTTPPDSVAKNYKTILYGISYTTNKHHMMCFENFLRQSLKTYYFLFGAVSTGDLGGTPVPYFT